MIVLMTDFGLSGPYVGQVHAAILRRNPQVPIVNLFADLPVFEPVCAAYLIPAFVPQFPKGAVFLCVVDPGVGTTRPAVFLSADDYWFVGPDNDIFSVVCARAERLRVWDLEAPDDREISSSFHGRDLFAPAAARLATGEPPAARERRIDRSALENLPADLSQVVYIDHYGNAMTGLRAESVSEGTRFVMVGRKLQYARTFGEAPPDRPFWYRNSAGLVEFALREDSVARSMGLKVGQEFVIERD